MGHLFSRIKAVSLAAIRGNGLFCFLCIVLLPLSLQAADDSYESDVRQAAHGGDAQAQFALALLYEYGGSTIDRDSEQSILWLERAGQEAVAGACLYLGLKYEHGTGVQQDYTKAACWYTCAARQQWPMAQVFLAGLYEKGKGVPISPLTALAWMALAAESGYPGAAEGVVRLKEAAAPHDMDALRAKQQLLLNRAQTPCN